MCCRQTTASRAGPRAGGQGGLGGLQRDLEPGRTEQGTGISWPSFSEGCRVKNRLKRVGAGRESAWRRWQCRRRAESAGEGKGWSSVASTRPTRHGPGRSPSRRSGADSHVVYPRTLPRTPLQSAGLSPPAREPPSRQFKTWVSLSVPDHTGARISRFGFQISARGQIRSRVRATWCSTCLSSIF